MGRSRVSKKFSIFSFQKLKKRMLDTLNRTSSCNGIRGTRYIGGKDVSWRRPGSDSKTISWIFSFWKLIFRGFWIKKKKNKKAAKADAARDALMANPHLLKTPVLARKFLFKDLSRFSPIKSYLALKQRHLPLKMAVHQSPNWMNWQML